MARKRRNSRIIGKKASKRGTKARRRPPRRRTNVSRISRPPVPERRNLGTHTAVVRAAVHLVRRGYNRVTIEAIAAAAGAGKQTIYRWWPSKAALYLEVYEGLMAEADYRPRGDAIGSELRRLLRRLFKVYGAKPARAILAGLIAEAQSDARIAKIVRLYLVSRQRQMLRPLFTIAQAKGEIRRGADLNAVVDAISAAMWFRLVLGQGPLNAKFADQLAGLTLRSVGGR